MNKLVLYTSPCKRFRILEIMDECADLKDLKGDCYDFEAAGYTGTREELLKEERDFEDLVEREGVFGYVLEKWNPDPDTGWEHVDCCWGFVGRHTNKNEQYIVAEMKRMIETKETENE